MLKQKCEKLPQKKATVKVDLCRESVEKMQATGKTCFLQHTKDTTHLKVRKGGAKMQSRVKHPKHNHNPKMQACTT